MQQAHDLLLVIIQGLIISLIMLCRIALEILKHINLECKGSKLTNILDRFTYDFIHYLCYLMSHYGLHKSEFLTN